jgi:hypothetical protein
MPFSLILLASAMLLISDKKKIGGALDQEIGANRKVAAVLLRETEAQ